MSSFSDVLNGFAFDMMRKGEYVQARRILGEALRQDPTNKHALNNLASVFKSLGREPDAIAIYERLLAEHPDFGAPINNLAFSYLRNGRYVEGWGCYRRRLQANKHLHELRSPITGKLMKDEPRVASLEELRGKNVLLLAEQGIGDELFFLRFTRRLKALVEPASIWYAPTLKLYPIFDRFDFPVVPCAMDYCSAPKENCVAVLVGDLPYLLGHDGSWFPAHGHLRPSSAVDSFAAELVAPKDDPSQATLGVTWRAGNPELVHQGGISKQIRPADLGAALKGWPGRICVMQRNLRKHELADFRVGLGRDDRVEVFDSVPYPTQELGHIVSKLETLAGYVGVSNTNMHLWAAMGRTAHVLVIHPAEWRWPVTGDESPWFPGFKLYRQDIFGWGSAMEKLGAAFA